MTLMNPNDTILKIQKIENSVIFIVKLSWYKPKKLHTQNIYSTQNNFVHVGFQITPIEFHYRSY